LLGDRLGAADQHPLLHAVGISVLVISFAGSRLISSHLGASI